MATQDLSNLLINNRYFLLQKIGAGGMATVYEAVDRELDKRVAVKVLNPEWRSDEEQVGRFRQEARTAARVRHPHLVDVTDRGITSDGIPFLVMELLEGKSLHEELAERGTAMPWRRVVAIIVQVCSALEAAHQRGLVHRDIKPGNCLLVQRPGQVGDFVKVLDLGIAKVFAGPRDPSAPPSTRTHQGSPGTPEFMAPEQVVSGPADARSDLYSLGVMMVRMLTGRLPFVAPRGEPVWKVLDMHLTEPPPSVRSMAPEAEIPESIAEIVLRCMAKRLDDRWSSAMELATALRVAEHEELTRLAASSMTGVRTTVYEPTEVGSPSRALFRVLMRLQATVLFVLSAMSLMLVELPGVELLAEWLDDGPRAPVAAPKRALTEPAEPVTPAVPAEPVLAPAAAPPAARPAAPPVVVAPIVEVVPEPPPPAPVAEPEVIVDSEPPPARPDVDKPRPPKKPRPKVADPFASTGRMVEPKAEVQKAINKLGRKLDKCRNLAMSSTRIDVEVELAAGTGKVRTARVLKGENPRADKCVLEAILTVRVRTVQLGGKFSATVKL